MRFDFWQSKQNILFGGLNFSYLYFSSQLCWGLHLNNFDFGSLDWSFSGSASSCSMDISAVSSLLCCTKKCWKPYLFWHIMCIQSHQERGSHLHNLPRIVFIQSIKCQGTSENRAFMSYSLGFWYLLYF